MRAEDIPQGVHNEAAATLYEGGDPADAIAAALAEYERLGYRLVRDDEATVERMAKSLWRGAGPTGRVAWEELPREVVRYWQREARAALTAAQGGEDQ